MRRFNNLYGYTQTWQGPGALAISSASHCHSSSLRLGQASLQVEFLIAFSNAQTVHYPLEVESEYSGSPGPVRTRLGKTSVWATVFSVFLTIQGKAMAIGQVF